MHIQTHLMSGWCVANLLPLGPRERLFCMVAATVPDLDGLGILVSQEWYDRFHHVFGHNLAFAVVVGAVLAAFSSKKAIAFVAYVGLVHSHFLMDFYGSGPGWGIPYWWPFRAERSAMWRHPHPWEFSSWQNTTAAAVFLSWTLLIVWFRRRTPLEMLMPRLDRQLVQLIAGPGPAVRGLTGRGDGVSDPEQGSKV